MRWPCGERFLSWCWGEVGPGGLFALFCGAKLRLSDLDERDVVRALVARPAMLGVLDLTGKRGGPVCASLRAPAITWQCAPR